MRKLRYTGEIHNTFDYEKYLFYFARMKAFFDLSHLDPKDEDEPLLQTAIELTRLCGQKNKITYNEDNSALVFFVRNFLEPGGQFYYEEEHENGFISLIEALEEILAYIHSGVKVADLSL